MVKHLKYLFSKVFASINIKLKPDTFPSQLICEILRNIVLGKWEMAHVNIYIYKVIIIEDNLCKNVNYQSIENHIVFKIIELILKAYLTLDVWKNSCPRAFILKFHYYTYNMSKCIKLIMKK